MDRTLIHKDHHHHHRLSQESGARLVLVNIQPLTQTVYFYYSIYDIQINFLFRLSNTIKQWKLRFNQSSRLGLASDKITFNEEIMCRLGNSRKIRGRCTRKWSSLRSSNIRWISICKIYYRISHNSLIGLGLY